MFKSKVVAANSAVEVNEAALLPKWEGWNMYASDSRALHVARLNSRDSNR